MKKRRVHSSEFKLQVVLDYIKGTKTINQLKEEYDINPTQINAWRKLFLNRATTVFDPEYQDPDPSVKSTQESERIIGRLTIENQALKKVSKYLNFP